MKTYLAKCKVLGAGKSGTIVQSLLIATNGNQDEIADLARRAILDDVEFSAGRTVMFESAKPVDVAAYQGFDQVYIWSEPSLIPCSKTRYIPAAVAHAVQIACDHSSNSVDAIDLSDAVNSVLLEIEVDTYGLAEVGAELSSRWKDYSTVVNAAGFAQQALLLIETLGPTEGLEKIQASVSNAPALCA